MIGLDAAGEAFRQEVRDFLHARLPADIAARTRRAVHPIREDVLAWTRILHERGWSVGPWPKAYGGAGWTPLQSHIFEDECYHAGAPRLCAPALRMLGPVIYTFGTEAQKRKFLPPIERGEVFWAQGFSEPEAGSDLFSLRTRAERDGDEYVINGSKIWTSSAHIADFIFVLLKTTQNAPRNASFSFIAVPTNAPGLRIRPILSIDGGHGLNEVFFENVRVPADNLLGEEGKGYAYARFLLENERTVVAPLVKRYMGWIRKIARRERYRGRPYADDPVFVCRMAQHDIDMLVLDIGVVNGLADPSSGRRPAAASALMIAMGEAFDRLGDTLLDLTSPYAEALYTHPEHEGPGEMACRPGPDADRSITSEVLYRRHAKIAGGSAEIQRNIVASVVLKLDELDLREALAGEAALLRDTVHRFVVDNQDFASHRRSLESKVDRSRVIWKSYAELGWLGAGLPEDAGGLGGGIECIAVIARELSRGLAAHQYIATGVLTGQLLAGVLPQQTCRHLLGELIEGNSLSVLAHQEAGARGMMDFVETRAEQIAEGYLLHGRKVVIRNAHVVDHLLVTAALPGGGGPGLFLLDGASSRLARRGYPTIDGGFAADVVLEGAQVGRSSLLASGRRVLQALEDANAAAVVASCSEAVGLMEWALFLTRDHLLQRQQFGKPLAEFQALRHRLAEMYVAYEQARGLLAHTLSAWDGADRQTRLQLASACKVKAGQSGRFVSGYGIQLHGGVGMTDEYPIGHVFKRISVIERQFGATDFHLEEYAQLTRTI